MKVEIEVLGEMSDGRKLVALSDESIALLKTTGEVFEKTLGQLFSLAEKVAPKPEVVKAVKIPKKKKAPKRIAAVKKVAAAPKAPAPKAPAPKPKVQTRVNGQEKSQVRVELEKIMRGVSRPISINECFTALVKKGAVEKGNTLHRRRLGVMLASTPAFQRVGQGTYVLKDAPRAEPPKEDRLAALRRLDPGVTL